MSTGMGVKAGCADHQVQSVTYDQDDRLIGANTDAESRVIRQ